AAQQGDGVGGRPAARTGPPLELRPELFDLPRAGEPDRVVAPVEVPLDPLEVSFGLEAAVPRGPEERGQNLRLEAGFGRAVEDRLEFRGTAHGDEGVQGGFARLGGEVAPFELVE